MQFLNFGRVVCNARLKREFGYPPAYSTAEAFDSFLTGRPVEPVISPGVIRAAESTIAGLLGTHSEPMATARLVPGARAAGGTGA
jgi:hypothetical protein